MKITIGNQYDAELILVSKDLVPAAYGDIVEQLKGKNLFKGEEGEVYSYVNLSEDKTLVFLGLGEEAKVEEEILRLAAFKGAKELSKLKVQKATVSLKKHANLCYKKSTKAFAEGLYHAEYRFDKYLSKKQEFHLEEVSFGLLEGKKKRCCLD